MSTYKLEVLEQIRHKGSYELGETDYVDTLGGYTVTQSDDILTIKDLLDELGGEFDDGFWLWSALETECRSEPIPAEIAEWKTGKLELFTVDYVAILTKTVNVNDDIRSGNIRVS